MYHIRRNFRQRKNFRQSCHLLLFVKFYQQNFLSSVNDYIEDMAIFTTLAKIYSTEYFFNTKVAGLGEIFVQQKFSHTYRVLYLRVRIYIHSICTCKSLSIAHNSLYSSTKHFQNDSIPKLGL